MPKKLPVIDPKAFSERLSEALAGSNLPEGRGRGAELARRYDASTVTANAWLNGAHMPSPDRVLAMADDMGVDFEWLYFGRNRGNAGKSQPPQASQVLRCDAETIADAMKLLAYLDELVEPPSPDRYPYRLAVAYNTIVEEGESLSDGNIIDITKRLAANLRKLEAGDGTERQKVKRAG